MTLDLFGPTKSAVLSPCGRYRYRLDRWWDPTMPRVCWVMLNPSTADGSEDDPTLRRVIGFSQRWGFGSLVVVNLFAWRATDPNDLPIDDRAVGPEADLHIRQALESSIRVFCGWGNSVPEKRRRERESAVVELMGECGHVPECLALTRDGAPGHPLRRRGDSQPRPYECKQDRNWPIGCARDEVLDSAEVDRVP